MIDIFFCFPYLLKFYDKSIICIINTKIVKPFWISRKKTFLMWLIDYLRIKVNPKYYLNSDQIVRLHKCLFPALWSSSTYPDVTGAFVKNLILFVLFTICIVRLSRKSISMLWVGNFNYWFKIPSFKPLWRTSYVWHCISSLKRKTLYSFKVLNMMHGQYIYFLLITYFSSEIQVLVNSDTHAFDQIPPSLCNPFKITPSLTSPYFPYSIIIIYYHITLHLFAFLTSL